MVILPEQIEGYNIMGYFTSPGHGRLLFTKNEVIILTNKAIPWWKNVQYDNRSRLLKTSFNEN